MSFNKPMRGGGYAPEHEPWMRDNSWSNQMWGQNRAGGHHGGQSYSHHPQGYGSQGHGQGGGGGYYNPGPPQKQPQRRNFHQPNRAYNQRPPQQQQQQHQGQTHGVKRAAPQHFNNGVTVVKRLRGARGSGGRGGPQKPQVKKEQPVKDECVVLDDTEKKAQEGFCKICQEKFDGTYNQHKLTKPHREKRAQKYPSCGPCGLKFNGDDARQRYEVHLGSKAHMQVVETAELDIKEGQEPEGTELCEPIEAVMCTLCECVFKKEFVDTHCKTKGHLKRITKKKADAERAAKKAEEDAKKASGETEGEKEENGDAAEENGDEGEEEAEEDFGEEEEEAQEGAQEGDTAADEAAAPEEELQSADANASEDATAAEEAEPAAEPETPAPAPAPEPVKATPAKRGAARRGRGRGRK